MIQSLSDSLKECKKNKLLSATDHIIETILKEHFIINDHNLTHHQLLKIIQSELYKISNTDIKLIFFCGGAAAGKTTLVNYIIEQLPSSATISTDDYFLGSRRERKAFDTTPERVYDHELLKQHIESLRKLPDKGTIRIPQYDPASGLAVDDKPYTRELTKVTYLILEGTIPLIDNVHYNIYLHLPNSERRKNWVNRNVSQKRETAEHANQRFYEKLNKSHRTHTVQFAKKADMLIYARLSDNPQDYFYQYDIFFRKPGQSK